jgi:hypothetical protein
LSLLETISYRDSGTHEIDADRSDVVRRDSAHSVDASDEGHVLDGNGADSHLGDGSTHDAVTGGGDATPIDVWATLDVPVLDASTPDADMHDDLVAVPDLVAFSDVAPVDAVAVCVDLGFNCPMLGAGTACDTLYPARMQTVNSAAANTCCVHDSDCTVLSTTGCCPDTIVGASSAASCAAMVASLDDSVCAPTRTCPSTPCPVLTVACVGGACTPN